MAKKLKNDMAAQFEKDAKGDEKKLPSNKQLKELGVMTNRLADLELEAVRIEEDLAGKKKEIAELGTRKIPDLFDEFGLSKLTLTDGTVITIKRSYAATITKAKMVECYKWLRKNKFGSLIKHEVNTKLKRGEAKEAKQLLALIKKLGLTSTDKQTVAANTLKAFVKEQIEAGNDFPQELFSVFPIRIAKVNAGSF